MKITTTNRRPVLAMIAVSALLLGGAALPKFSLKNPTLLYMGGQIRMAVGDQEGGLRMLSAAAELSQSKQTKNPPRLMCKNGTEMAPVEKTRQLKSISDNRSAGSKQWVAMREFRVARPEQFQQVARLEPFVITEWSDPALQAELKRAAYQQEHSLTQREAVRSTLAHVRSDLERHGIAIPASFGAGVPEPPMPPVTNP